MTRASQVEEFLISRLRTLRTRQDFEVLALDLKTLLGVAGDEIDILPALYFRLTMISTNWPESCDRCFAVTITMPHLHCFIHLHYGDNLIVVRAIESPLLRHSILGGQSELFYCRDVPFN